MTYADALASTQRKADRFLATLTKTLDQRAADHTHAYVTESEANRLRAYALHQPGHTTYRYSTFTEDLSDAAQEVSR